MAQIAARAGVSKNTVSLALRRDPRLSVATRERIVRIAKEVGYQKNPVMAQLMVELRRGRPAGYQRTLGLLNAFPESNAFTTHPTIPVWVEGCRRRAAQQGFRFDEFWLHDPSISGTRLHRILRARAISGFIVVGAFGRGRWPREHAFLWEQYPCVVAGVRTYDPTLSFCCVDHHEVVLGAMEELVRLGYRRPALAVDNRIDRLVDGRFSAAMWRAQQRLPAVDRLPSFSRFEDSRYRPEFLAWFRQCRPDVILTLHTLALEWLASDGIRVPEDVGVVALERRRDFPDWAGMDQHNDVAGEAAVDLLMTMMSQGEAGVPVFPRGTFIGSTWVAGTTVRRQIQN